MVATLYYIHDPMCSWCWGYRPTWNQLQQNLPNEINVVYVAGGLAADSNDPMPLELQQSIQQHWKTIHHKLGTEFNFGFWIKNTPRRSTYMACRAAIAAGLQSFQEDMIDAIQKAYYLRALNPSDRDILTKLGKEISDQKNHIDYQRFCTDLVSDEVQLELERQITLARELTESGFPSLSLELDQQRYMIPVDYKDYSTSLDKIISFLD